eukprot:3123029-Amphidinium_carterae.1
MDKMSPIASEEKEMDHVQGNVPAELLWQLAQREFRPITAQLVDVCNSVPLHRSTAVGRLPA